MNFNLVKQIKNRIDLCQQKKIQDSFDVEMIKNATELNLFILPNAMTVSGGVQSIFSICKYSRQVCPQAKSVLVTGPGKKTYASVEWFLNDEKIYRWEQVIKNLNAQKVVLHIPEFLSGKFYKKLTPKERKILSAVSDLQINILNQSIESMPEPQALESLKSLTKNITQTIAHDRYATQEVCNKWKIPTHLLSVFIDCSGYKIYPFEQKEKIIALSPDEAPYREAVVAKLQQEFPDFRLITINHMTFSEYMDLIARAYFTVTFGEGMDGYFAQPTAVKSLGFAVYNDNFFPGRNWLEFKNVYKDETAMIENLAADMKKYLADKTLYEETINQYAQELGKLYRFDDFYQNLKDFYERKYDFYPKRTVYIVGGNGFARECYYNLLKMKERDPSISFGGFMGHGGYGHTVDYKDLQKYYVGEVAEHEFKPDEFVIIGAGYPELRNKIYDELKARNIRFFTLKNNDFCSSVEMGESNIFAAPFSCSCNIKIGNNNVFNGEVIIGHDAEIGDGNFFGPRTQVLGNVKVGSFNQIGANTVLLPHCKIGNNNKIAPLSAVYKGCKNNAYMNGNPALKIGDI